MNAFRVISDNSWMGGAHKRAPGEARRIGISTDKTKIHQDPQVNHLVISPNPGRWIPGVVVRQRPVGLEGRM